MNSKKFAGPPKPSDSYGKQKEFKQTLESKKPPALSFESELAMAQKSLKLLKAKMATPKVQDDYASNNNNNYNSRNDNISSANENNGNGNNNYRKIFKPDLKNNKMDDINAKPKNNYPLEEIQRNDFAKKPDIKLSGKMYQDKKPGSVPSQDDFEYYDRNTRDYSKYQYQEEATKLQPQSKLPTNNSQKNILNSRQVDNYGQDETFPKSNNIKANQNLPEKSYNFLSNNQKNTNNYEEYDKKKNPMNNNNYKGYNQQYQNSQESDADENEEADKVDEPDEFQDPSAAQELVQCTMGCGRSFKADFIKKHMKICKKVFQSKRKAFDSSKNRTVQIGEEEYQVKKKFDPPTKVKPTSKKENWKNQSESFRSMLKMAKGGKLTAEEEKAMNQAREDAQNLVLCNSCGRKFNEKAADKHIPFCEKKSKMEKMKAGNNAKGRR